MLNTHMLILPYRKPICILGLRWPFSLVEIFSSRVETTRQQTLGKLFSSFLRLIVTNLLTLSLLKGMKLCLGPEIDNAMLYIQD